MTMAHLFRKLRRDDDGAAAIEFGLLGAFLIFMLIGILQVGIAMQNYNALRSVGADIARHAIVQYQTGNNRADTLGRLQDYGWNRARGSPYNLPAVGLQITVTQPTTQRVTGATELRIAMRSQINPLNGLIPWGAFYIRYSRPIFVLQSP